MTRRLGSSRTTSGPRHHLAGKRSTRCTADDGQKNGTPAAFIAAWLFLRRLEVLQYLGSIFDGGNHSWDKPHLRRLLIGITQAQ